MPKARILAVDDQRYFRELIEGLLAEEGYEAQTASSGEEALRILEQTPFDVVLTDLVMPGMDGSELVHRIKDRNPDQDIVVVTGVVDVKTAVDAMKLGAGDYLLKPFDGAALVTAVDGILRRRRLRVEHAQLLEENISYLGERGLFERALGLFGCVGVEPLSERIVEALCQETDAQAGVLWVGREGDPSLLELTSARGLSRLEHEPRTFEVAKLPAPLQQGASRTAIEIWSPGPDSIAAEEPALLVSLRHEGRVVGFARLTDKLKGEPFDLGDASVGEKLARFGEAALANALRISELERRSLKYPDSGAYSLEYLRIAVRTELGRATRFGRSLSLMKVAFEQPPGEDLDAEQLRRDAVGILRRLLRSTDPIASDGPGSIAVLLAEVDPLGAAVLKRRARRALLEIPAFNGVSADAGPHVAVASFPADGTQLEALERALDERLEQARAGATRRLEERPIGECLEILLGDGEVDSPERTEQIACFLLAEVGRKSHERGLLFLKPGAALAAATLEGLAAIRGGDPGGIEVVVFAEPPASKESAPSISWVEPERIPGLPPFLIHFGPGPSYALIQDEKASQEGVRFFHTSERGVVEHLSFQLQAELAASAPLGSDSDDDTLRLASEDGDGS